MQASFTTRAYHRMTNTGTAKTARKLLLEGGP
jgi:hypothetical protein